MIQRCAEHQGIDLSPLVVIYGPGDVPTGGHENLQPSDTGIHGHDVLRYYEVADAGV